jgi:hypothetical protein
MGLDGFAPLSPRLLRTGGVANGERSAGHGRTVRYADARGRTHTARLIDIEMHADVLRAFYCRAVFHRREEPPLLERVEQ